MSHELVIADVMQTEVLVATLSTHLSDIRTPDGKIGTVVVVAPSGGLVGVLPPEAILQLQGASLPLSQYQHSFKPPTLTTKATRVQDVLAVMAYDKHIRWHVVLEGTTVTGVVSPSALFAVASQQPPEQLGGETPSSSVPGLFGPPDTLPLCYRCLVDPTHIYKAREVERDGPNGRAICKIDKTYLIAEHPCRGKA